MRKWGIASCSVCFIAAALSSSSSLSCSGALIRFGSFVLFVSTELDDFLYQISSIFSLEKSPHQLSALVSYWHIFTLTSNSPTFSTGIGFCQSELRPHRIELDTTGKDPMARY
jgi:hypothetical protein